MTATNMLKTKASRRTNLSDLALKYYLAENPISSVEDKVTSRKEFEGFAMAQINFFIFAGHDITSTGAIFNLHLLSINPASLARIRAEHGAVFGDVASTASVLCSKPQPLSQLPFTLALSKKAFCYIRPPPRPVPVNPTSPWQDPLASNFQRAI